MYLTFIAYESFVPCENLTKVAAIQLIGLNTKRELTCLGPIITSKQGVKLATERATELRLTTTEEINWDDINLLPLPERTSHDVVAEYQMWFIPLDCHGQPLKVGYDQRN